MRKLLLVAGTVALVVTGSWVDGWAHAQDPDTPTSSTDRPGAEEPRPRVVRPRPGMENVHPIHWERYEVRGQRRVRIFYWSGVEPCYVLDHVDVAYRKRTVRVTLFEGSDPAARDQACIEIAEYKAVDVNLSEGLRGRRVVDGYRG